MPTFVLTICDFLGIGAGGWICVKVFAVEPVCVPGISHTEDDSPAKGNKPSIRHAFRKSKSDGINETKLIILKSIQIILYPMSI